MNPTQREEVQLTIKQCKLAIGSFALIEKQLHSILGSLLLLSKYAKVDDNNEDLVDKVNSLIEESASED